MNDRKMYTDEDARLNVEQLPFSARLWSVKLNDVPGREWRISKRYNTSEYIYKRYYKFISRRATYG